MTGPAPLVFDRPLGRRRLARAVQGGYVDFLLARAADDLLDRLAAVKRDFPLALDAGSPTAIVAERLRGSGQVGGVVRLAPIAADEPSVVTALGDEEALPFAASSFDLAISCLALQGTNDLPGALVQIRRALRPDGLFLASLFGGDTLRELRESFAEAESEIHGGASPRVAPFVDVRAAGGLLQRAGFALPVVDVDTVTVRFASPFGLLRDLRGMGLTNTLSERSRTPLRRGLLGRMAAIYAERFGDPDGRIRATFDVIWMSGWAPHESQPKPLRPGSATTRLADALGTAERPAGEGTGPLKGLV